MKKIVKIDEKLRDMIESYDYEINARKYLISFMLSNNMNIDTPNFSKYQDELKNFIMLYERAKSDVSEIYVDPLRKDHDATWRLIYKTCELHIDIPDLIEA